MLALVIDTSSAAVTAGLVRYDTAGPMTEVVAERVTVDARGHAEFLIPAVAQCLREAGATAADVQAVVAGVGPGPFTGLRVGLMTAAAFADARGIPTYGVCSLDALAATTAVANEQSSLLVATDARRKEVYFATYAGNVRTFGPAVAKPAELISQLRQPPEAMVGVGAGTYRDSLGLALLDGDYPTVLGLAMLAADRVNGGAASEALVPLYLRRPDAVVPTGRKPVTA